MARVELNGTAVLAVVGLAVGGFFAWRFFNVGKGLVSGDNAITRSATDADGKPVSAYQSVPVLGTIGAATNAASGGYLASLGGWIGGKLYDWTHGDPAEAQPVSQATRWRQSSNSPEGVFDGVPYVPIDIGGSGAGNWD